MKLFSGDLRMVQLYAIILPINIDSFWLIALLGAKWCCIWKLQKTILLYSPTILAKKNYLTKIVNNWKRKDFQKKKKKKIHGISGSGFSIRTLYFPDFPDFLALLNLDDI